MFDAIAIHSPVEGHRIRALGEICRGRGPKPISAILPMLKDKSPRVRA